MHCTKQLARAPAIEKPSRRALGVLAQMLALISAVVFSEWVGAQALTVQLTPGVAATAIGCAPSNNGTGHMVCLEYGLAGALIGVSWETPPARSNGVGTERAGTLDQLNPPLPNPAATPTGAPGCGPANDGSGTVSCLVVTVNSGGYFLLGVAFYPPLNTKTMVKNTQAELQLGTGPIAPATATVGNPSCTGVSNGLVACAIVVNQQLYATAFDPRTGASTALTSLPLGNVVGSPGCTSVTVVVCAVRQNGGLLGFSFQYNPTTKVLGLVSSMLLAAQSFTGDPSCVAVADGQANCAILNGNSLLGVYFNTQTGAVTGLQSLGAARDSGVWSAGPGCGKTNDGRANSKSLTTCAVVSSRSNVFYVTFDPRAHRKLGVSGPFSTGANGVPSCLPLAIDADQLNCGAIMTNGTASGIKLPVGLLSPPEIANALSVLF